MRQEAVYCHQKCKLWSNVEIGKTVKDRNADASAFMLVSGVPQKQTNELAYWITSDLYCLISWVKS